MLRREFHMTDEEIALAPPWKIMACEAFSAGLADAHEEASRKVKG